MQTRKKVLFAWSGGKDSSLALHELRNDNRVEILALMTTVTQDYDRISMHGVRRELLEQQADSIGIPLEKILISTQCTNAEYEEKLKAMLLKYKDQGVTAVAFGDIFLEDLKKYRQDNLARVGMTGIFPIWKRDSSTLARDFIHQGFKAILTCVDSKVLDPKFAGRSFDEQLLLELPPSVDPCGENGEFHSFVHDGPIFKKPIPVQKGEIVCREERFYYCDLCLIRRQPLSRLPKA